MFLRYALLLAGLLFATACSSPGATDNAMTDASTDSLAVPEDVHSYARPNEAAVTHLDLTIEVDFDARVLRGKAAYDVANRAGTDILYLDTKALDVRRVTLGNEANEEETAYELRPADEHLGRALQVTIRPETERVTVYYQTSPDAEALQWLTPAQTAGGEHPFLFTQGQAILTRSWVPIQDSPGVRITYTADVKVPPALLAVMSAENPTERNETGEYHFEMRRPVPGYLLALAVGDLRFASVGARTGVYAEPEVLERAAYEFAEMPEMLAAAEELYGPYAWERYDVLVLPPSFPFGGMENPRLTFATPTILAGDRSLTSLIAHELAHSWSGNLVTNATWDDFWLNEGFTVYFERRIVEALYGADYTAMLTQLGGQDLASSVEELPDADTHLKLNLDGRNPDDGMTDIAYEKGYFLLRHIEDHVGRERFDAFLREYFDAHRFEVMWTEKFLDYLRANLLEKEAYDSLQIERWVYGPGVPGGVTGVTATRFVEVDKVGDMWTNLGVINTSDTEAWSSHEWLYFLRGLPRDLDTARMAKLDEQFAFTTSGNSEIQAAWYELAILNRYEAAYPQMRAFLQEVGRRKFLVPLYRALKESDQRALARAIYAEARPGYHYVSQSTLDALLDYEPERA
ncbi:MAG: M1 family metallopeptidase [Catalinimonas sp.]